MAGVRKHRALPPDFERANASSTLEYEAGANMRKKNSANAKKGYNSAQRKADDAIVAAAMARHAQRKAEEAEEASKQKIADLERMLAETRSDFISTKRKAEHLSSFVPSSSSSMMTMASDGIGNLYNAMRQRHSRSSGLTISQSIIDTAASPTGPLGSHGASATRSGVVTNTGLRTFFALSSLHSNRPIKYLMRSGEAAIVTVEDVIVLVEKVVRSLSTELLIRRVPSKIVRCVRLAGDWRRKSCGRTMYLPLVCRCLSRRNTLVPASLWYLRCISLGEGQKMCPVTLSTEIDTTTSVMAISGMPAAYSSTGMTTSLRSTSRHWRNSISPWSEERRRSCPMMGAFSSTASTKSPPDVDPTGGCPPEALYFWRVDRATDHIAHYGNESS